MAPRLVVCAVAIGLTCACSQGPASTTSAPASSSASAGQTRTYFIAADDVVWDFAPSGKNQATGQPFNEEASFFAMPGPMSLGHVYKKSLFREYTDATFKTLKPRPRRVGAPRACWARSCAPRSATRSRSSSRTTDSTGTACIRTASSTTKDSEGAEYNDGTGKQADDAVSSRRDAHLQWPVPERAGPGARREQLDHLDVSLAHRREKDVNSGLIGPMIVTAKGQASPDGSPKDVDREIVAGFLEVDENLSWYIDDNIKTYAGPKGIADQEDRQLRGSVVYVANLKETINGYVYGNTPGFTMQKGQKVRWYLMASTNFEIHSPHWHGNTVVARHMRTDVAPLLPMDMVVADMDPGQRRHVAVPLPHGPASAGGDDFEVHGDGRGDEITSAIADWRSAMLQRLQVLDQRQSVRVRPDPRPDIVPGVRRSRARRVEPVAVRAEPAHELVGLERGVAGSIVSGCPTRARSNDRAAMTSKIVGRSDAGAEQVIERRHAAVVEIREIRPHAGERRRGVALARSQLRLPRRADCDRTRR